MKNKLDHLFPALKLSCGVVLMITMQPELKWKEIKKSGQNSLFDSQPDDTAFQESCCSQFN